MEKITVEFPSYLDPSRIEIELPRNETVAVMLSGGADSALLFWFLYNENRQRNLSNTIIPFVVDRPNGSVLHSNTVIDFFRRYFDKEIPYAQVVGDSSLHHSQHVWSGVHEITYGHKIKNIYVGGTQNPPPGVCRGEYPKRSKTSEHRRDVSPFIDCDKRHILYLYKKFNLLDLLDITHSCGIQSQGKCHQCFSCDERQWALTEICRHE